MSTESYRWHYDYTRILWDAGFCFNNHKSLKAFDRNGIALLDIERIIRDRDIRTVDYHIQNILDFTLDSEEARILDQNFVKLFRLSQLAVEYLNYCKKYLDATTDTLKKELQKANEENNDLKNDIVNYDLEVNKLRKKVKDLKSTLHIHQKYVPPHLLPSTSATYRCSDCKKSFISIDYLKKHILKRHPHSSELDHLEQKLDNNNEIDTDTNSSVHPQYKAETDKLQMEIKELKEKLNNTERFFQNKSENVQPIQEREKELKPQSEEYYKYVEELHHQFELLKTQIESEMQVLKSQKIEKDKYEELMEKFLHKLEEKTEIEDDKIEDAKIEVQPSTSKVDSPVQTDDITMETDTKENTEIITVGEQTETTPKKQSLTKTVTSAICVGYEQQEVNVEKIKLEVEKNLELKSKQNLEKLSKQITENISNSFDVLQDRLETFWNKLQEIEKDHKRQQIIKSPSKPEPVTVKKDNIIHVGRPKIIQKPETSSDDSETESSKEDHVQIVKPQSVLKTVQENDKMARNLLAELKTKVELRNLPQKQTPEPPKPAERQKITVTRSPKPFVVPEQSVKSTTTKDIPKPAERPTISQIYKRAMELSNGEETDSESEYVSEESESEVPVKAKPSQSISTLQNRSVSSLENALRTNPEILIQLKEDMKDIVNSRLTDLGIDPDWSRIPDKTYNQNNEIVTHHRNIAAKNVKSFMDIRNNIVEQIEDQVKELKQTESRDFLIELEPRPSRLKILIQNMRNKAKSFIKHDRTPTPTTPVYKLTIHKDYNSPKIKQPPEKQIPKSVREQNTMYESDSSETETSKKQAPVKLKPPTKKDLHKSKSESSMEVVELSDKELPQTASNTNLTKSLDSILEIKKELSSQLSKSDDKLQSVSSIDTNDKPEVIISPRNVKKSNTSSSDDDSDDSNEKIQKSVLKNMATTTAIKKKVLFDLHSEKNSEVSEQPVEKIKKTIVKPNQMLKINDWDDSSSIDSSILELKKGSNQQTKGQGDTISTKAVINVSTKQNKTHDDISDWDISDIN